MHVRHSLRFANHIEDQIAYHVIAASEAVVLSQTMCMVRVRQHSAAYALRAGMTYEVDAGPRSVVHHIERDVVVASHGLEVRAALLGQHAVLVDVVAGDRVVRREVTIESGHAG